MPYSTLTIDVEVLGLEKVKELVKQMEDEKTVFKAEMGEGIKFEGTKSDFNAFVEGIKNLHKFTTNYGR